MSNYTIGGKFTAEGREWTITGSRVRPSKEGRSVRVFTITDGETTIEKTSRGLTFWIGGGERGGDEPSREQAGNLAAAVAAAIAPYMDAVMDEDAVAAIVDERIKTAAPNTDAIVKMVREEVANLAPRRIEVKLPTGERKDMGVQHSNFEALYRAVGAGLNVWLVGPAGTGKTSAAAAVAKALNIPFHAKSIGPQTTEGGLLGYMHGGHYVRTPLRDAYEHGGVMLLDECDAAAAGIVVANAVAANPVAGFPDGVVERHPNFRLIAGANTIGQGADAQYVSRQPIDAATLDRFVFLPWDNDPRLESAACGVPLSAFAGLPMIPVRKFHDDDGHAEDRCVEFIQQTTKVRMALNRLGKTVRMIVGNRTNQHGTALVRAGWTVADALEATVWRGAGDDLRNKVRENMPR